MFDEEAGLNVSNADDVTNYLQAIRLVQVQLGNPKVLPIACASCVTRIGFWMAMGTSAVC